jgi:hypothetical protein
MPHVALALTLTDEEAKRFAAHGVAGPHGKWMMAKHAAGSCIHLIDGKGGDRPCPQERPG